MGADLYDGEEITAFNLDSGLLSNFVNDMAFQGDSTFYFATENGLSRYGPEIGTGIENESKSTAVGYALYENYPNPFNPETTIRFTLPRAAQVNLTVYNLRGQEVATLVQKQLSSGSHQVVFTGSELSSGIYFYQLSTPKKVLTGKMTILK